MLKFCIRVCHFPPRCYSGVALQTHGRYYHTSGNVCRRSNYSPGSEYKSNWRPNKAERILSIVAKDTGVSEDEAASLLSEESMNLDSIKSFAAERKEEDDRRDKRRRWALGKQRYFKPKPVDNLLTWSAKEQIRHLHKHEPEQWTVERLAESFPCDAKLIAKVLKNRHIMYSQEDIVSHDEKVREKWSLIASGKHETLCAGTMDMLSTKPECMKNSDGIKSLPLPTPDACVSQVPMTKGLFSTIIKDYIQMKDDETKRSGGDGCRKKIASVTGSEEDKETAGGGGGGFMESRDHSVVVSRESARVMARDAAQVRPDSPGDRFYNVGYLRPPTWNRGPRGSRGGRGDPARGLMTFDDYKRRNPGVVAGGGAVPEPGESITEEERQAEHQYHQLHSQHLRPPALDAPHAPHTSRVNTHPRKRGDVSVKSSYFADCQRQAQRLMKQGASTGKETKLRTERASVFNVPCFLYATDKEE